MEVFVQVVQLGGFSHAARQCGMSQSAVSKLISRLEMRLGVRLFNRSTRRVDLTAEGCIFYERALSILSDIEDAEREASRGETPVGHLRLNTSASYAVHILEPILPLFLDEYPDISVDLILTDHVIDMLAERTDIVVRAGPLKSSSLIARKLGDTQMLLVAAPSYLQRHGEPESIADLGTHCQIGFGYPREVDGWRFSELGEEKKAFPRARIHASDGETVRRLALNGLGIAALAEFTVRDDMAEGRLKPVLGNVLIENKEEFHAIHIGQGGPLPARVRAFLNFLADHGQVG